MEKNRLGLNGPCSGHGTIDIVPNSEIIIFLKETDLASARLGHVFEDADAAPGKQVLLLPCGCPALRPEALHPVSSQALSRPSMARRKDSGGKPHSR